MDHPPAPAREAAVVAPPAGGSRPWGRRGAWVGPPSFTRQAWVAVSSAGAFVLLSLLLVIVPVPFVVRSPGGALDLLADTQTDRGAQPVVELSGSPVYTHTGQLLLLSVAVSQPDSLVPLPEALLAHWTDQRDVMPRDLVYPPGMSADQLAANEASQRRSSQKAAAVAGLRAAGVPVESLPMVTSVTTAGPSYEKLRPGDLILKVGGKDVAKPEDVYAVIAAKKVNEVVTFQVQRGEQLLTPSVTIVATNDEPRVPSVGARFDVGYTHDARVGYHLPQGLGGPLGGLMLGLAVYERASSGDLVAGRRVAGAGDIDAKGVVGPVGGMLMKVGAAEATRADIMLVPESNCSELVGVRTPVRIIPVATLADAVAALNMLKNPRTAGEVPSCS